MTEKEKIIMEKINKKQNGAYFTIQYATNVKEVKCPTKTGNKVTKVTTMSIRKGINNSNRKAVIAKRSSADYIVPAKPQWFTHVDRTIVRHNTKEQLYVMGFPNPLTKAKSQYFLNGVPVSLQELKLQEVMTDGFWTKKEEKPEVLTIKLDNIIEVF